MAGIQLYDMVVMVHNGTLLRQASNVMDAPYVDGGDDGQTQDFFHLWLMRTTRHIAATQWNRPGNAYEIPLWRNMDMRQIGDVVALWDEPEWTRGLVHGNLLGRFATCWLLRRDGSSFQLGTSFC